MSKPESTLWKNLREGTKELGVFWTRLESWSSPGVPDLHGILDGHAFWLELKVHRLNSLNKIALRPHQIAWQIRYSGYSGNVWNLVGHPSSSTIFYHRHRPLDKGGKYLISSFILMNPRIIIYHPLSFFIVIVIIYLPLFSSFNRG